MKDFISTGFNLSRKSGILTVKKGELNVGWQISLERSNSLENVGKIFRRKNKGITSKVFFWWGIWFNYLPENQKVRYNKVIWIIQLDRISYMSLSLSIISGWKFIFNHLSWSKKAKIQHFSTLHKIKFKSSPHSCRWDISLSTRMAPKPLRKINKKWSRNISNLLICMIQLLWHFKMTSKKEKNNQGSSNIWQISPHNIF